jgi:DNA-binding GntR family transcriptional regulator
MQGSSTSRRAHAIAVQPLDTAGVHERLGEDLRRMIISGEIAPETRLSEYALAASYGVSRTPVREALKQLQVEGLVNVVPRVGTFVAQASHRELNELTLIKEMLEGLAARQLAQTRSPAVLGELRTNIDASHAAVDAGDHEQYAALVLQFHQALVNGSENSKLIAHHRIMMNQLAYGRLVRRSLSQPGRLKRSLSEHDLVVELIEAGDPDGAEMAMRDHVAAAHRALMRSLVGRRSQQDGHSGGDGQRGND